MKTKKFNSVTTIAVSLIALLGVVVPACSSDDSDGDNTTIGDKDASADDAGGSSGNGGSGNASGDGGDNGGTGGNAPSPDGGGGTDQTDGGDGGPIDICSEPLGEDGCYNCPSNTAEFLNRCTNSDCEPFPNATRLPHLNANGTLPPLP